MPAPTKNKKPTKHFGAAARILPLDEIQSGGIKMMIYGHSGTGKTRLMGTFGVLGKLLHIVCSGNGTNETRSIRGTKNIYAVELEDPYELPELIDYAAANGFETVTIDHITEFCSMVLARVLKLDKLPEQLSWGLAKQQDYQQMGLQAKELLRSLLDFPGNSLFLGQQRTYDMVEDEDGSPLMPYVSISATPAVSGWLAPACDYIVQTYKDPTVTTVTKKIGQKEVTKEIKGPVGYFARTGPSEIYTTKFRVPLGVELPDVIEDPSYQKMAHLLG